MPVPWAPNCSETRSNASYTTARGRLRWQASPAVRPISLQLMSELYPPRRNHLQELAVLKQTQAALSACALWRTQADASSRCFSELMRAIRCSKRHMPETGQAMLHARTLGVESQCSTQQRIIYHCAWSLALAGLSSCASNQSACN